MAGNTYQLVVDAVYRGGGAFQQASRDLSGLDSTARSAGSRLSGSLAQIGVAAGAVGLAVTGVAVAAKKAWDVMGEGAALNRTAARFDKLSESIGTTATALTARLRAATHGTISDMELMANASQLISLRLADNADQVVRLGAVAGTLQWDMRQVILTFANMSTMRLDALGLSVSDVTSKARELELQGMSSQEAFKEAVILAGEAQKALLDVGDDAVRGMQQAEAGFQNAMDSVKMGAANVAHEMQITGIFSNIGYRAGQMGLSDLEKDVKHAAELIAQIPNIQAGGKIQWNPGLGYDFRQIAKTESGRANLEEISQISDDTQQAIAVLELYRSTMDNGSEAAAMLDAEIAKLNAGLQEQAAMAALAAAGGRNIADVYTEWATAAKVQGEQAENFVKAFNAAIGGITAANVDAGPLISFGEAAEGAGIAAGNMQFNVESANAALYEAAQAAGASAAELALLGVATGQFTEAEADAALKTAILQEAIARIASDYAEGEISIRGATDALREQIAIISNMPSMFEAASTATRHLAVAQGAGGGGITGQPWYRPVAPLVRRDTEELERATPAVRGFSSALSEAEQREKSLLEIHGRMASAFASEAFGNAADGLINADGTANAEALSKALYDQAKAAGATAGQLALLGVATGALTEDQARAALKAAVLTEQARKLAAAVVAGQMGFGEAAAGMITFGAELDATAAGQDLTSLATAADNFAESVYEAELAVDNDAANLGLMASIDLANEFQGTYTATLHTVYTSSGGPASPTGSGPMGDGAPVAPVTPGGRSRGGADLLPYGGGSIYPNSRAAEMYTSYQGGSSVNVTVTNYVDGKMERSSLDDVTTDALKRAMAEIGMVKR